MKLLDYDYDLPPELIAQHPFKERDRSRLLVLHRADSSMEHREFRDIIEYLRDGDCLVLNETKVIPARIFGRKNLTGGKVEVLLTRRLDGGLWEALVNPGRRAQPGTRIVFDGDLGCDVVRRAAGGKRVLGFDSGFDLSVYGHVPLPPYVKRPDTDEDRALYQTVYARVEGAVAAPTAGLHFSKELLERISEKGIDIAPILLHVGPGTFRPVKSEDPRSHIMEKEYYEVSSEAAEVMNSARLSGGRIIAVGTTSVRTLETVAYYDRRKGKWLVRPGTGWTDKFIYPPYRFKFVDVLVTNFHLPRTTLLLLVSAFAGRGFLLSSYREAIARKYRFYSYGDAMLIV